QATCHDLPTRFAAPHPSRTIVRMAGSPVDSFPQDTGSMPDSYRAAMGATDLDQTSLGPTFIERLPCSATDWVARNGGQPHRRPGPFAAVLPGGSEGQQGLWSLR